MAARYPCPSRAREWRESGICPLPQVNQHPTLAPGTLIGGKFRIERLLGAGAMGTVYAIEHALTHHKRALKLLHPSVQNIPDIVGRFLNEASAAGRAGNAHLVETFDAGTLSTGEPYVVMELLEGETLGAVLDREKSLDASPAAELVAQAAEGMAAAHRAGIVHRDLKPDNLFVTARDGRPFVKIMDFGVSKFATGTSSATRAGMVYGSPAYMSPEQLTGRDVDARTDVFALGIVLYQCLTGKLPFEGTTLEALIVNVTTGAPTPIDRFRADLPRSLVEVILGALVVDRDERLASAAALVEALAPFRPSPSTFPPDVVSKLTIQAVELSLAATIASVPPPMAPVSGVSEAPSEGLLRPRPRWPLVPVAIAVVVAIAATLLVARSGRDRPVSLSAQPLPASLPAASSSSVASTAAATATPAPEASIAAPATGPTRPSLPRPRASSTASPDATSTASVPPRSSAVQSLGLSQDNPFR
jgi:eukaryotic-like serine/threonine-protein kinase